MHHRRRTRERNPRDFLLSRLKEGRQHARTLDDFLAARAECDPFGAKSSVVGVVKGGRRLHRLRLRLNARRVCGNRRKRRHDPFGRKGDDDFRIDAQLRLEREAAAMQVDEIFGNRQTEARALFRRLLVEVSRSRASRMRFDDSRRCAECAAAGEAASSVSLMVVGQRSQAVDYRDTLVQIP